jgi:glucose/arabinose dehydrogenase
MSNVNLSVGNDGSTLQATAGTDPIYGYDPDGPQSQASAILATRVATGLTQPLFAGAPPGDISRLFIVEKTGEIKILDLASGQVLATPFLDLSGQVDAAGERGLLGLAFDPNFANNGFLYVDVSNPNGNTDIRRYHIDSSNPNVVDPASATPILSINQSTFSNHKGGWLGFGPEGDLYISVGDGGGQGNPLHTGQDINSLLGKILRIDVHGDDFPADPTRNYHVPADNPFVGQAGAAEIFAFGLRNPWRPSFDRLLGNFYIADVGENTWEEIDLGQKGANYGWNAYEGPVPFPGGDPVSNAGPLVFPIYSYDHSVGHSITGGYVYRGPSKALQGQYFFADFVFGKVFTLRFDGSTWVATDRTAQITTNFGAINNPSSFGEDARGNLYLVDFDGDVFKLTPTVGSDFKDSTFELAAFAPTAGGWSSQNLYPRELVDVNGDGKADIVGFSSAGVYVSLATGGGQFASAAFELPAFGPNAGGWYTQNSYPRALADVNGDGKADIVGFSSAGVYVSLAIGGGQFAMPAFELGNFGPNAGGWSSQDTYPRELADVTGDGTADIVGFGDAGVYVSRAMGGGQFAAPTFELGAFGVSAGGWSSQNTYPRMLADIEGSGMADIVGFGYNGVYVSRNLGNGHFAAPTFELANFGVGAGGWSSQNTYPRELADVNGDGMADIVGFADGGVYVSLASGGGHFAASTFKLAAFGPSAGGWSSQDTYPREVADIGGDGMADIVGFASNGVYTSTSVPSTTTMAAAGGSPSNTTTAAGAPLSNTMMGNASDTLQLDPSSSFSRTVAGMSAQDTLSLTDTSFATVQPPMSGATPPVADSTASANIALLGNYLASTLVPSSEGYGGASTSQAAEIGQNTLLTQPQHT